MSSSKSLMGAGSLTVTVNVPSIWYGLGVLAERDASAARPISKRATLTLISPPTPTLPSSWGGRQVSAASVVSQALRVTVTGVNFQLSPQVMAKPAAMPLPSIIR